MGVPLPSPTALAPLLSVQRLGVLTDFDGTIAPIAVRPDGAVVSPTARAALAALATRLPLVGVMSGRALFDLRAKLDMAELLYIGSHGLAWSYEGIDELPPEALPFVQQARNVAAELAFLLELPGLRFEDKGTGLAIHYRLAPDAEAARERILAACAASEAARSFEIREGILVVELFPRLNVNKGTALRHVIERFRLDGLLFLGDDLTDVDAMYAAAALRRDDAPLIATIAVRHAEAPALAAEAADWTVDGVAGAEQVLEWMAEAVAASTPGSAPPGTLPPPKEDARGPVTRGRGP